LVAGKRQVCGGECDPARLQLDADCLASEVDGLDERRSAAAHRIEHEPVWVPQTRAPFLRGRARTEMEE
jgi:hypothetical protein